MYIKLGDRWEEGGQKRGGRRGGQGGGEEGGREGRGVGGEERGEGGRRRKIIIEHGSYPMYMYFKSGAR